MPVYVSPGVYIREIDLSQYAPARSISTFAVVGGCHWGPLNDPTLITNEPDLLNQFGTPTAETYMIYAGQLYLRNGRQLRVVRVADGTQTEAEVDIKGDAQNAIFIGTVDLGDGVDLRTRKKVKVTFDGGTAVEVDLSSGAANPASVTLTEMITAFNAAVQGATAITVDTMFRDNTARLPVFVSPTTGVSSTIKFETTSDPAEDATLLVTGLDVSAPQTYVGVDAVALALKVKARFPGNRLNNYRIFASPGTDTGTFDLLLQTADGTDNVVFFDNLTIATVEDVINGQNSWIEVETQGVANFPTKSFTYPGQTAPTPPLHFLAGGKSGISGLVDADYIGSVAGKTKTGLRSLEDTQTLDVNIIAVPGVSSAPTIVEGIDLARRRADAIFLIDPPFGEDAQGHADFFNGQGVYLGDHASFNSSYAAGYGPWIEAYDVFTKQRLYQPPSGWVASQIAYTDFVAEPWFAPAGFTRGHLPLALNVETHFDQGERDFLYSGGNVVNPIVNFPIDGITIWGQRTTQRIASALDRINVRRMLIYAEKVIGNASRVIVFEPNDAPTRRRLTGIINPILADIAARRGIERFSVRIDESTNPPVVVNRNELHGQLLIIPTKAAEIIQLDFVILPSGANFGEVPGLLGVV